MAKTNSTQNTRVELSSQEVRLIRAFRLMDDDEQEFWANASVARVEERTIRNTTRLSIVGISPSTGLKLDQAELLRSYDGMHPEDKVLIRDFAKLRCIDHGITKRPALRLIHN